MKLLRPTAILVLLSLLLLAQPVVLDLAIAAPPGGEDGGGGPPPNRNCFADFNRCRQGCITTETQYFLGGVIDWDTNLCFLDCDLTLVTCLAFTLGEVLDR